MKKFTKMLGLSLVGLLGLSSSAMAVNVSASDIDFTAAIASIGVVIVALLGFKIVPYAGRVILGLFGR